MTTSIDFERSHEHLRQTIESYFAHKYESDSRDYDRKSQSLLDWARKVSAKTGIPLENL